MTLFADRTREMELIDEAFQVLLGRNQLFLRTPIIDLYGTSGIGKTSLLEGVKQYCQDKPLPCIWVDLSQHSKCHESCLDTFEENCSEVEPINQFSCMLDITLTNNCDDVVTVKHILSQLNAANLGESLQVDDYEQGPSSLFCLKLQRVQQDRCILWTLGIWQYPEEYNVVVDTEESTSDTSSRRGEARRLRRCSQRRTRQRLKHIGWCFRLAQALLPPTFKSSRRKLCFFWDFQLIIALIAIAYILTSQRNHRLTVNSVSLNCRHIERRALPYLARRGEDPDSESLWNNPQFNLVPTRIGEKANLMNMCIFRRSAHCDSYFRAAPNYHGKSIMQLEKKAS